MAKRRKQNRNFKGTKGSLDVVTNFITATTPIVIHTIDAFNHSKFIQKERKTEAVAKNLVPIPELYNKNFPYTIEQARIKLESEGFKMIPSQITLQEARPEYKDCLDMQVVSSQPKSKELEKFGATIMVRYVTQEIIDRSRIIFEETERHKAEVKLKKATRRFEHRESIRQTIRGIGDKVKVKKKSLAVSESPSTISGEDGILKSEFDTK